MEISFLPPGPQPFQGLFDEPAPATGASSSPTRLRIAHALCGQIIPHLVRTHGAAVAPSDLRLPLTPLALAERSLHPGRDVDLDEVDAWLAAGHGADHLNQALIAPAAHLLGAWWAGDTCNFAEVTLAVGRLHRLVRQLGRHRKVAALPPASSRRVLLMPAPGEQHTLGLAMVEMAFESAGWDVQHGGELHPGRVALTLAASSGLGAPRPAPAALDPCTLRVLRRERFDAVGLSLGSERLLDGLRRCIADIRRASLNRQVLVMVGGAFFLEHPAALREVGADVLARDAATAPSRALRMLQRRADLRPATAVPVTGCPELA